MRDVFDANFAAIEIPSNRTGDDKPFWSKDPPRLHDGHVVAGGMFEHQRRWWDLPNFIKLLVTGYGGGKTFVGAKRIIASALNNAPAPVAVVSPTFPIARHTTIATITSLLAGKRTNHGRNFWWRYNKTMHEFRVRYHGREGLIIVYSGEDPASLIGPNLAAVWIDEPFVQDEAVFKQMVARVRNPEAVKREIFLTGTPEQLNWGWGLATKDEEHSKYDVGVVHASTAANLALGTWYTDQLRGAFDGKAAEAYIEGRFVNLASGQVYYAFDSSQHVVRLPTPPGAELGAGMDFNVNPMAMCVFWRAGSHLHFIKEYELPNADTEYACSLLRDDWCKGPNTWEHLKAVYPDATGTARKTAAPGGKSDFWYIQAAKFETHAPNANPKRRDRYNAVNGKFKPTAGRPTITIDPSCKRLIKYLSLYNHEGMNRPEQKAMSHLLDAFSYPIAHLFPAPGGYATTVRLVGG